MKEIMFEFATFLLATVQAATLMWIMAGVCPLGKKVGTLAKPPKNAEIQNHGCKNLRDDV